MDNEGFIERYERRACPVVITDAQLHWQATHKWSVEVRGHGGGGGHDLARCMSQR